ncbi:MAG: diguanylate cyclase [Campylobacterota bacterium]|nr:diguanylate cyclase [Campylobacterota bacterium]
MYDFSQSLKENDEMIFNEFTDKYTICINSYNDEIYTTIMSKYRKIVTTIVTPFNLQELMNMFEDLAQYKMSISIPYIIMINEIHGLKSVLISNLQGSSSLIVELLTLFEKINNKIAKIYLDNYIKNLLSINNIRINSLSDLVEKNIISHYESHLIWLTELAKLILLEQKTGFVELNHKICNFGVWLESDAKNIIKNNSKHKIIDTLHRNLHTFAQKIFNLIGKDEHHILIIYLEKCELISLSIGTELALIDNILMNKKVTKDTLTGSLNREALKNVFESQYELSLATNSSFVLAMCDLDFFKAVNDNHGHIAGDKLLKSFVDVVKKNIRNSDVIVRYGGEEFIVMLPAINKEKGKEILDQIRTDFQKNYIEFDEKKIQTTVSIGMMEIKPHNMYKKSFVDEYIMIVDQKLYMAKDCGRNRVEVC